MVNNEKISSNGLSLMLAAMAALGPFSTDTYLPSIPELSQSFDVSTGMIQQTLTAYMVPFAIMTLWHGAISDSLGRRKVIITSLAFFTLASIGCMFSNNVQSLMLFRALQGLSAGGGMVVGRAVVRDVFEGAEARKLMAKVAIVFAIAPAVGPVIGGWLQVWFGWRSVFAFLTLYSGVMFLWTWKSFPETLPEVDRHPIHPVTMLKGYFSVFGRLPFVLLVLSVTLNFSAVFIYIMSAPVFLMEHLGLGETEFYWLFIPVTIGMVVGTWMSSHTASYMSNNRTILWAYVLMLSSALTMVVFHHFNSPSLPWTVIPLIVYVLGSSLAMPSLTIMAIDLFLKRKGLASSCQSFVQSSGNAIVIGIIAPLAWVSVQRMAHVQLLIASLALLTFLWFIALTRGKAN